MHNLFVWLLAAAFFAAGMFNIIGTPGTRNDFARWGYPAWWNLVTGSIEIASSALIAFPSTRLAGLILGGTILGAATLTLMRHREFSHLAPVAAFAVLLAAAASNGG